MATTKIEYLDYTWNPIAMCCTPCSEGCAKCWHIRMANRLSNNPLIPERERNAYAGGSPILVENRLDDPIHIKKPSRIGVQFMGDLFHEAVTDEWLQDMFDTMYSCPQHTFILLTKRPENAYEKIIKHWVEICEIDDPFFANVWMGVTAENQRRVDERILELLKLRRYFPVLFVSAEPMLSAIKLQLCHECQADPGKCYEHNKIDWVIAGCETGPGARPMNPEWARDLLGQCRAANVPFFMKKMSGGQPIPEDLMVRQFPQKRTIKCH